MDLAADREILRTLRCGLDRISDHDACRSRGRRHFLVGDLELPLLCFAAWTDVFLDNSDGDGMIRIEDGHGSGMGDGPLSRELRAGINERGLGQEMKGEAVSIV